MDATICSSEGAVSGSAESVGFRATIRTDAGASNAENDPSNGFWMRRRRRSRSSTDRPRSAAARRARRLVGSSDPHCAHEDHDGERRPARVESEKGMVLGTQRATSSSRTRLPNSKICEQTCSAEAADSRAISWPTSSKPQRKGWPHYEKSRGDSGACQGS